MDPVDIIEKDSIKTLPSAEFNAVLNDFLKSGFSVIFEDSNSNSKSNSNIVNIRAHLQSESFSDAIRDISSRGYEPSQHRDGSPRRNRIRKKVPSPRGDIIINAKLIRRRSNSF